MKRALLIVNTLSGSAAAVDLEEVKAALESAGLSVKYIVEMPDTDCPGRGAIEKLEVGTVILLSGDGTVARLCEELSGWPGDLLVLPGGTMNLLSRRLHGDIALPDVLEKLETATPESTRIPIIRLGEREILTGLTVGPSTGWGEVREGIRKGDVANLAEKVPEVWAETLADKGVWVEGTERQPYAAIFVEPNDEANLFVVGFRANNIGDMIGHGVAWLRRDFREGPRDDFGMMEEVTIIGDDMDTGLLVDGEYADGQLPLTCSAGLSSVNFLRMK